MIKVIIDERSLVDTAAIIVKLNPCGYTQKSLIKKMRAIAERGECTIAGTLGYYVAVCPHGSNDGSLYAQAFPASWLVRSSLMSQTCGRKRDIAEALQIVLDLAKQGALEPHHIRISPDLQGEYDRQHEAIRIVEDMAVNQFGDE